jgi:hypothetical protein
MACRAEGKCYICTVLTSFNLFYCKELEKLLNLILVGQLEQNECNIICSVYYRLIYLDSIF